MNKKRLFLCLLMAMLVPSAMFGQEEELTVFEGTETCREAPMYVYYFDDYTRAQTVFPATELEDMVGSPITAIKFYTTSENIPYTTVSTFDIYLTEVNATSISSFVGRSGATTVYSGTGDFVATNTGGEITITLSTPYLYQGGNLLFGCDNITNSGYKEINFYGQSKTGASISGYNASSLGNVSPTQRDFIPKTTFFYTPSCPRPIDLVVSIDEVDVTNATIGWTETGEATSWLLQIATNATFTEGLQEYTVNDNSTKDLTGLIPETRYYARVKADCGDEHSYWSKAINFRPSNTIPLTLNDGDATNEYVPVYGYYAEQYQKSEFIIPASTEGLAAMTDGTINQMTFYLSTPASESWGNARFQVFIKEVSATGFSSENYGNLFYGTDDATIVYEGPLDGTQSTMVIDFTTNYHYNGGNLLVGVYETTKGTYKRAYFAGNASTGGSLRNNNSSSLGSITTGEIEDFLPKTTFNYLSVIIPKPANLQVHEITSSSATISWTAAANNVTSYQYKYKTEGEEWTTLESTTSNSVSLSGLTELTSYTFQVKAIYSEGESDFASINFTTKQNPVLVDLEHPFEEGFEGEHCEWELLNGNLVNRWIWGVAVNNGDVHSLYVSNNGGVTNTYNNKSSAVVYAVKRFTLEQGVYNFTFDWRANGEESSSGTSYDYLRVALIPNDVELIPYTEMPDGFGYNQLPEGWIALDGGTQLNLSENWNTYSEDREVPTAGSYMMVFIWRNDDSSGNNPPAAIDNVAISRVGCPMPTGLACSNITDTSVALNWTANGMEEAWEIEYRAEGENTWQMVTAYENPYLLEGLVGLTTYEVRIKAVCSGATTTTQPIAFTTKQTPIFVDMEHPFEDDFEGELCGWELVNGELTNQWVWGSAANNGGDKALYISNDNGLTNAYDISKETMVYATKLFALEEGAYYFEYDWQANGEGTSTPYDYLRVALIPANETLVAGTSAPSVPSGDFYNNLPSGWIALDGGGQLSLSTDWISYSGAANITTAGNYKVVFAWRSDYAQGTQPPAAIDNFSLIKLPCTLPTELAAYAMFTTAELSWTELGYASQWNLQWRATGASEWNTISNLDETSYSLIDLTPTTEYVFRVQPSCTDDYWSDSKSFTTHCEAYEVTQQTTIMEGFESDVFPPDCWQSVSYVAGSITRSWLRDTNHTHTGSASAYSGWFGPIYLNMPIINISQEALYAELSFWSRVSDRLNYTGGTGSYYGSNDGLSIVKVSTDYGMTWTQLWCPTIEELPAEGTWEKVSLDLTNYKNQDILITFEYQGNDAHRWYIDDVELSVYEKVFIGGSAEDATAWFDAGNWQPEGVPTLEQNAYITAPAVIAEASEAAKANRIELAEQGSLTIADGGQLMTNNKTIATVKKNIVGYGDSEGGYYLIANPLTNTISPVKAGLITTGSNYDLYDWDYAASDGLEWLNYKENTFDLYNRWGVLYANESNVELSFTGTIKANNLPVTFNPSYSNSYEFGGWWLYGNPFVCDAYLNTESSGMAFYRMNATGDGFETATGPIHPMEGFFVQATASGQSLTISREAPEQRGQLNMNLSRNNKRLDNAIVIFGEGQNLGKLSFRENSSKIYVQTEDKDCATVFTTGMGEIPVSFKAETNGSYTLSFTNEEVSFSYLRLIDNMTGIETDLLEEPYYTFNATTTDYASRFRLVFATGSSTGSDTFAFLNSSGNLTIYGIEGEVTLQVVDMLGHVLSSERFSGSYEKKLNVAPGVYMLRLINGDDVKVQKMVIK